MARGPGRKIPRQPGAHEMGKVCVVLIRYLLSME